MLCVGVGEGAGRSYVSAVASTHVNAAHVHSSPLRLTFVAEQRELVRYLLRRLARQGRGWWRWWRWRLLLRLQVVLVVVLVAVLVMALVGSVARGVATPCPLPTDSREHAAKSGSEVQARWIKHYGPLW